MPGGKVTISQGIATHPEDGTSRPTLVQVLSRRLFNARKGGNAICAGEG